MSAYNVVTDILAKCPRCRATVVIGVQFKFGATWQHRYGVGDTIRWGGNDVGRPGRARVVADGAADVPCPACGYEEDWDFYVLIEQDQIIGVVEADGTYDFVRSGNPYLDFGDGLDPAPFR